MRELVFESTPPVIGEGRVDGPCALPEVIPWPCDADSFPLFHLLSVPTSWLIHDGECGKDQNKWISIFISYDKKSYSHYGKMSSDELNHSDAVVLLHDMSGPERSEHSNQSVNSKSVRLIPAVDGDDNVASYVEAEPSWVQDPIQIEGFKWVMSIYGPDMDSALTENRGILSDGVGYIFLKENFDLSTFGSVGKFFFQL